MGGDVWMLEERLRLEEWNVYQDVLDPRASWLSRYRRVAGRRHLRHAKERTTLGSRAGEGGIVLGYTAEGHRQGAEPTAASAPRPTDPAGCCASTEKESEVVWIDCNAERGG